MSNLTKYGPGKFDLVVDQIPYGIMLDGFSDTIGNEDTGIVEIIRGPFAIDEANGITYKDYVQGLQPVDRAFLAQQVGAILTESDQGFVTVRWFDDQESFDDEIERLEILAEMTNEEN